MRVSVWVAFGLLLHLLEGALMPRAFPFRLGLAHLAALLALSLDGFGTAMQVSIWRAVVGSLFYGTFLQMSFFLSLTGAVAGTATMALALLMGKKLFSEIGISLAGAAGSAGAQCLVASLLLGSPMLFLLPVILILGLFGGLLNGVLAHGILEGRTL